MGSVVRNIAKSVPRDKVWQDRLCSVTEDGAEGRLWLVC